MRRPRLLLLVAILFSSLVGATAWYKENGFADIIELKEGILRLDGDITELERSNRELKMTRAALTKSDLFLEGIARQDLGLVRPNEVVYEFIPAEALSSPAGPSTEAAPVPAP